MFPDKLPVCFVSFARAIDLNRPSVYLRPFCSPLLPTAKKVDRG